MWRLTDCNCLCVLPDTPSCTILSFLHRTATQINCFHNMCIVGYFHKTATSLFFWVGRGSGILIACETQKKISEVRDKGEVPKMSVVFAAVQYIRRRKQQQITFPHQERPRSQGSTVLERTSVGSSFYRYKFAWEERYILLPKMNV